MGALTCVPMILSTINQEQPLLKRYQTLLHDGYEDDPVQHQALVYLADLQPQLHQTRSVPPRGLYLWGPVGRGKTFLMDLFCDSLREDFKNDCTLRLHFHRFMALIHQQLQDNAGQADPLLYVAQGLAQRYRVLCFDEFLVAEIGDAMLLGRLIRHLFRLGVTLVCTSNRPPEELYRGDIHRERFEPTVQLLHQYLNIVAMAGEKDHRLRSLTHSAAYFVGDHTPLHALFAPHREAQSDAKTSVMVCNRPIPCIAATKHAVWFDFQALCEGPRSHLDYIDLAKRFNTLFLSDVPLFGGKQFERIKARGTEDGAIGSQSTGERQVMIGRSDDPARRFIALVDELYDRRVNLFLNAATHLNSLYQGDLLAFEFQRTISRLTEMASLEYQQAPHQP